MPDVRCLRTHWSGSPSCLPCSTGRSAHLDPFPAALGDIQVTPARHSFLDGEPFHRRYLEQDCADERCDRIDLPIRIEGVEVIVLDVERYPILVEVVDDLEGFEGIASQTTAMI